VDPFPAQADHVEVEVRVVRMDHGGQQQPIDHQLTVINESGYDEVRPEAVLVDVAQVVPEQVGMRRHVHPDVQQ